MPKRTIRTLELEIAMAIPSSRPDIYSDFPDRPDQYRQAAWEKTLSRLFVIAVTHATDRIKWYEAKAGERAAVAKRIRWWALFLFAIGTLAPILLTFLTKVAAVAGSGMHDRKDWQVADYFAAFPLAEIGYVMLAIAGALVVFDQFFDASGSWIRFRQSQARLEVLLADFRFSWARTMAQVQGAPGIRDPIGPFTELLREFVMRVEMLAEEETTQWAKRFSEMIESFDRNPNLKVSLGGSNGDAGKTGRNTDVPAGAPASARDDAKAGGSTPAQPGADGTAAAAFLVDPTVTVRLAIVGADTLDSGSLQLFVDEEMRPVPPDGLIELSLDAGHKHTLVATGRRNSQAVRDQLDEDITSDDENKSLALKL